jgi:hypothetical protein
MPRSAFQPNTVAAHRRWKDLYLIGGVCGILMSALTIVAIPIYLVVPYQPGLTEVAEIFATIQSAPFAGLMSLDFFMVVITIITVPFFLALYVALRGVDESYALIAVVCGMISCIAVPATIIDLLTATAGTVWNVLVALSLFRLARVAAGSAEGGNDPPSEITKSL